MTRAPVCGVRPYTPPSGLLTLIPTPPAAWLLCIVLRLPGPDAPAIPAKSWLELRRIMPWPPWLMPMPMPIPPGGPGAPGREGASDMREEETVRSGAFFMADMGTGMEEEGRAFPSGPWEASV